MEKDNTANYIIFGSIVIVIIALLGLYVYLLTNNKQEESKEEKETEEKKEETVKYNQNDLIEVVLGDNITGKFYVISDNGDNLTLISEKILFTSRFYDYDGKDCVVEHDIYNGVTTGCVTDYEKSTLKTKLLTYTKDWKNATGIRIPTAKEIANNSTSEHSCGPNCFKAKEYQLFIGLGEGAIGEYWINNEEPTTDGFATYVSIWKDETTNTNYMNMGPYFVNAPVGKGCRAVITISKEYVK